MSADIVLDGKTYISSKRASEITGYTQDYIGQLARGGQVDAKKIGGLWHVNLQSLLNAGGTEPESDEAETESSEKQPEKKRHTGTYDSRSTIVSFDGKEYISSKRATELSRYSQDYIGQLARSGKILSRQVGSRWYVAKDDLLQHKAHNDALLAAVQTESVGVSRQQPVSTVEEAPVMQYFEEAGRDLMPKIETSIETPEPEVMPIDENIAAPQVSPIQEAFSETKEVDTMAWSHIPIKNNVRSEIDRPSLVTPIPISFAMPPKLVVPKSFKVQVPHSKSHVVPILLAIVFPSIFAISAFGLNFLESHQTLAQNDQQQGLSTYMSARNQVFTAAAAAGMDIQKAIGDKFAAYLEPHLHYEEVPNQ